MTGQGERPTLEQVAEVAGTSRATVSRVINHSPQVSVAVRETVERAIAELGYTPNRAARSLVTRRTDSVGLVVAESEQRVFGEPFFADLVRGVSTALAGTDVQLVLLLNRSDQERSRVQRFLASHVDGVMLVSAHAEDPLIGQLSNSSIPAVLAGRPLHPTPLPYVDVDNVEGAQQAVKHLAQRGCRRIATITGPQDMAAGIDRLTGYRQGLAAAGLPYDDDLVVVGDFSGSSGEDGAAALLDRYDDLDGVFAASDLMAIGTMQELKRRERRVPDDIAVVGYDDSVIASTTQPGLSSVHQPIGELGRQMIDRLRELLEGSPVPGATILPTHLVVRESSRRVTQR